MLSARAGAGRDAAGGARLIIILPIIVIIILIILLILILIIMIMIMLIIITMLNTQLGWSEVVVPAMEANQADYIIV